MNAWERRAFEVQTVFGVHVDWEERFYICPYCEEPIYEEDWQDGELDDFICPVCEDEDGEE